MTNNAPGIIRKQGVEIKGEFPVDGLLLSAHIDLPSLAAHPIGQLPAVLEYNNTDELFGPFKIEPDSVVGPNELSLSLVGIKSGVKAKITAPIFPPLPSGLSNDGVVIFTPVE
ncbi:hypothetical protein GQ42DRAFT_165474 [Ramicandelaber brevisporus]|nr:hypothetical protein GQ42DRAFT_165474 [Ramicandelaber brevisporus]